MGGGASIAGMAAPREQPRGCHQTTPRKSEAEIVAQLCRSRIGSESDSSDQMFPVARSGLVSFLGAFLPPVPPPELRSASFEARAAARANFASTRRRHSGSSQVSSSAASRQPEPSPAVTQRTDSDESEGRQVLKEILRAAEPLEQQGQYQDAFHLYSTAFDVLLGQNSASRRPSRFMEAGATVTHSEFRRKLALICQEAGLTSDKPLEQKATAMVSFFGECLSNNGYGLEGVNQVLMDCLGKVMSDGYSVEESYSAMISCVQQLDQLTARGPRVASSVMNNDVGVDFTPAERTALAEAMKVANDSNDIRTRCDILRETFIVAANPELAVQRQAGRASSNPTSTSRTRAEPKSAAKENSKSGVKRAPVPPCIQSVRKAGLQDVPKHMICPITQDIMHDPVVASDGHTYESTALSTWLLTKSTSPMTGAMLPSKDFFPNFNLRSQIIEYAEGILEKSKSSGRGGVRDRSIEGGKV